MASPRTRRTDNAATTKEHDIPHSTSSETGTDLTDEELAHINGRLERVLDRFDALPFHALLYRLGEVAANRVDERKLRRALAELSNNRRPRRGRVPAPGPWEGSNKIYVSAAASHDEAALAADAAAADLRELTGYCGVGTIDRLADALSSALKARGSPTELRAARATTALGGDIEYHAEARLLRVSRRGAPVHVLTLHEPGWLYPDDRRLWRFLTDSARDGARAVVIARAIAPGTFPLLKALGAVGAQYYSTLVADDHVRRAERLRDALGWSHVRAAGEMATHPVVGHVDGAVARLAREGASTATVRRALERAEASGLTSAPTVAGVLRWWHASDLPLPALVARGWTRWIAWDAYRRGRSVAKRNSGDEAAVGGPASSDREGPSEGGDGAGSHLTNDTGSAARDEPPREFRRETQVIPLGLPLPRRVVEEILAGSGRTSRRRRPE